MDSYFSYWEKNEFDFSYVDKVITSQKQTTSSDLLV
jgi:hypothetical protein